MSDDSPLLAVHALECRRGRRRLFRDLSFTVAPGRALRVTGRNGSGKTTLLRALCGLTHPESGRIEWRGRPLAGERDAFHAETVYLGHAAALKDDLSALENLAAALAVAGLPPAADPLGVLAGLGLESCARLPARQLSQGQRRRVALARLWLSRERPLWILDEPFVALDAEAGAGLTRLLDAHLDGGGALVFTTHQEIVLAGDRTQHLALGS